MADAATLAFTIIGKDILAVGLLFAVAAGALTGFGWLWLKPKGQMTSGSLMVILLAMGLFLMTFATILAMHDPASPGRMDQAVWEALQPIHDSPLLWLAMGAALLANPYLAIAGMFALFVRAVRRDRWPEAYVALLGGPGFVLIASLIMAGSKRLAPLPATVQLPMGSSFPSPEAAFLPALAALWYWLEGRPAVREVAGTRGRLLWLAQRPGIVAAAVGIAILAPMVIGRAWFSDILAGASLAGIWLVLGTVAWFAIMPVLGAYMARRDTGKGPWEAVARVGGHAIFGSTIVLWALIAIGAALRISTYWTHPISVDGDRYAVMGWSLMESGHLIMPWGQLGHATGSPAYSHHYPPLWPWVLSLFYRVGGYSDATTHVASILTSLVAMAVVYAVSRDLYGHKRALIATAALAVSPMMIRSTGVGLSENLVLPMFAVTMWAILKSLDKPWYIVPAGVLAGLGYLAKSSVGYFFILAGFAGLAWRLYYRGLKIFRDPAYITAIAGFGAIVVAWSWRNIQLFGSPDTSQHLSEVYVNGFRHPIEWLLRTELTFVHIFVTGYLLFLGLLPWLHRIIHMPKLESEHDSGLWLAFGLPLVLTAVIDAGLWMLEGALTLNTVRYVTFVQIPMVWLIARHAKLSLPSVRVAAVLTVALLLAGSIVAGVPRPDPVEESAAGLRDALSNGDSIALVGYPGDPYGYHMSITDGGQRMVNLTILDYDELPGAASDWVFVLGDSAGIPGDYQRYADYHDVGQPVKTLWQRATPPTETP